MTNMDTIPHSLRSGSFEQSEELPTLSPLSVEQIATSAVATIAVQLRISQGLPVVFQPEITDFIDRYF